MTKVICGAQHVDETIGYLQEAGQRGTECVVLWLAGQGANAIEVKTVYRPAQFAESDVFRIPPASMRELMNVLSSNQLRIAAQVHSHPFEAFHSPADDTWAIIRHRNALSLVVPHFALRTDARTFRYDTKVFKLDAANRWVELANHEVGQWLQIP